MLSEDFKAKLPLYKTAYSPQFNAYVSLRKIKFDQSGEPLIYAVFEYDDPDDMVIVFRHHELTKYCL